MKTVMFGATHSGAGKTTITLGVMHALMRKGLKVQPFKVGPDYIDTGWHKVATEHPSYNLDAFMLSEDTLKYLFSVHARQSDINIIEGVMGLFDGFDNNPDFCSSASLAKMLHCPIILVVDGKSISTSIAATVMGFQKFSSEISIAGVLINRVSSERHYQLLKAAIETYCQIPVLGYLPKQIDLVLPERHLGLVPSAESENIKSYLTQLSDLIERYVDLDKILTLAQSNKVSVTAPTMPDFSPYQGLKMAIAQDRAFHFYYQDNLELLKQIGIELIPFSPLNDQQLPQCDLIYIGGGFPEVFAEKLAENQTMRQSLLMAHQQGTPIYAECGGLMYLGMYLRTLDGLKAEMAGILPGYSEMSKGLKRFGYCEATALQDTLLAKKGQILKGHEFHHSEFFTQLPEVFSLCKKNSQGEIIRQWAGGYQLKNTLGSYTHIHFYQNPALLCLWLDKALT